MFCYCLDELKIIIKSLNLNIKEEAFEDYISKSKLTLLEK